VKTCAFVQSLGAIPSDSLQVLFGGRDKVHGWDVGDWLSIRIDQQVQSHAEGAEGADGEEGGDDGACVRVVD
jgi:hypothetical protein